MEVKLIDAMTCRYVKQGDTCKNNREFSSSNDAMESKSMSIRGVVETIRRSEKGQLLSRDREKLIHY